MGRRPAGRSAFPACGAASLVALLGPRPSLSDASGPCASCHSSPESEKHGLCPTDVTQDSVRTCRPHLALSAPRSPPGRRHTHGRQRPGVARGQQVKKPAGLSTPPSIFFSFFKPDSSLTPCVCPPALSPPGRAHCPHAASSFSSLCFQRGGSGGLSFPLSPDPRDTNKVARTGPWAEIPFLSGS